LQADHSQGLQPPPPPPVRLALGVTGHRPGNAAYAQNEAAIMATLGRLFDVIANAVAAETPHLGLGGGAATRLHSMLVDGVDQIAALEAIARGWDLVAPLPFGQALNRAINAHPESVADAHALLAGAEPGDSDCAARAAAIDRFSPKAQLFPLADRDPEITSLYLAMLDVPHDRARSRAYAFAASERVELAAHVMIEQSDLLIGVWDGASTSMVGGTGHTIALALDMGAPVVWIDARRPDGWFVLNAPEELAAIMAASVPAAGAACDAAAVERLVGAALRPAVGPHHVVRTNGHLEGPAALASARWRPHSTVLFHGYRRVEALFGATDNRGRTRNLTVTYEPPAAIAGGSAAAQLGAIAALPGQDATFVPKLATGIMQRFAWADGISAHLSDTYRGGMMLNFLFSAFAITVGIAYLPFATSDQKWLFALVEMTFLIGILGITFVGQRRRWHGRWFETRRVAEYLRQAPYMLLLGVARPAGRWPRGTHTSWPEHYARHTLREIGLPRVTITTAYLRAALQGLLLPMVTGQRDYHRAKAARLARAHHQLDAVSETLFTLAVVSVASYLAFKLGGKLGVISPDIAKNLSYGFTFLGVFLPTFGGAISGMRFFGDFERFSAISEVTAEKLDGVAQRLHVLLAAPESAVDYARAAELAHATDDIVIGEIESWQAVFGGKHITVPV
jgi:hypothetical protein